MNPFASFDREMAMIRELPDWKTITEGFTDTVIRRERVRASILQHGMADKPYRESKTGVQITPRLDFALVYNQALDKRAVAA
jgi:hypothetical protein